ncbi:MAG: hypothetical protein ACKVHE_33305 [Planctomycetales bacterium]
MLRVNWKFAVSSFTVFLLLLSGQGISRVLSMGRPAENPSAEARDNGTTVARDRVLQGPGKAAENVGRAGKAGSSLDLPAATPN